MNLRRSRLDDYWRTTYKRKYPVAPKEIACRDGDIFGGLKLELEVGINAIIGKNGTGKSNFIRSVFNSFSSENSNRNKFKNLLDDSFLEIEMTLNDNHQKHTLNPKNIDSSFNEILALLFDPCNLIPDIQQMFSGQNNIEELLEGYSVNNLNQDGLKLVNFLTNSTYEKIEIINIEDEFEPFPKLPYFKVEKEGASYDSRSMGLGEMSLLYFYWLSDYIKKSDLPCLLLVEEPESFLPPLIQDRLCDVLALNSATKGATTLISTHSEHILKKIPRSHIHIMRKNNSSVRFHSATSNFEQMCILGLNSPKKGLLFFEDQSAYLFTCSFLKSSPQYVLDSFYFHKSGSEGDVVQDLSRFPSYLENFCMIAVFDGDCKGKIAHQLLDYKNYLFLPSKMAPDELLVEYVSKLNVSILASYLSLSEAIVSTALDVAEGSDHHDYFHELAQVLDLTYDVIFSKICDLWIEDVENNDKVNAFISELEFMVK